MAYKLKISPARQLWPTEPVLIRFHGWYILAFCVYIFCTTVLSAKIYENIYYSFLKHYNIESASFPDRTTYPTRCRLILSEYTIHQNLYKLFQYFPAKPVYSALASAYRNIIFWPEKFLFHCSSDFRRCCGCIYYLFCATVQLAVLLNCVLF